MVLIGLDGTVETDTASPRAVDKAFAHPDLLREALQSEQSAAIAVDGKQIFWVVVVPVRAPVPIASIAAFIPMDAALLEKLRQISSVPRSIALVSTDAKGRWVVEAQTGGVAWSSPPQDANRAINAALVTHDDGSDYLIATTVLKTTASSARVRAVLSSPTDDAMMSLSLHYLAFARRARDWPTCGARRRDCCGAQRLAPSRGIGWYSPPDCGGRLFTALETVAKG
jgi:hypothetical protein